MSERDKTSDNPFAESFSAMTQTFTKLVEQNQSLMGSFLDASQTMATSPSSLGDPLNTGSAFAGAMSGLGRDPQKLMQANYALWKEHMSLWQDIAVRVFEAMPSEWPASEHDDGGKDRRFRHEDWTKNPMFEHIRRSYQITSRWMLRTMGEIEGLDEADRKKVMFHTQLLADAFAPSNFFMTNPEALRLMVETNGQSLVKGMQNLARDLDPETSQLKIMMTDPDAFTLGVDIATTPGKVVYQNELMQLIQYAPSHREGVHPTAASSPRRGSTSSTSSTCSRRTRSSPGRSRRATRCSSSRGSTPTPRSAPRPSRTTCRRASSTSSTRSSARPARRRSR